jgi:hypothetical protein
MLQSGSKLPNGSKEEENKILTLAQDSAENDKSESQ